MKNFKKEVVKTFVFLVIMALVGPVYAGMFKSDGVKKAQEFIDVGRKDDAIRHLLKWTDEDHPKDFDAIWMCANLLVDQGSYDSAYVQFDRALKLQRGKKSEVVEKLKNAFQKEVAKGDVLRAKSVGKMVIGFEPAYGQQVYAAFYKKGKISSGQVAVNNFEAAFEFASTQTEYEKIGKNFLKISMDDSRFGYLVDRSTKILGKNFVDQVLPSKSTHTLFTNTYTEADLGADGKVVILDFTKTKIIPGDVLNVYTSTQDGGGNVTVYHNNGAQFTIHENRKYYAEFEKTDVLDRGCVAISFSKGHETKIRTEMVRIVEKKADYTNLSGI